MRVRTMKRWGLVLPSVLSLIVLVGVIWFEVRYDETPSQSVALRAFSADEYPEDPEKRSVVSGDYRHGNLIIQQTEGTRFRFLIEPVTPVSTAIELADVDLAHFVAAAPAWARADGDLTKIALIDREWNRQQVRFSRHSAHVQVHEGGDGFEQRALTRVDLARNCLNAGLWELLLFTKEDGGERVYEHLWFTFPLGLYKELFEQVTGLSYWSHWWSLEHWVDPSGTPVRLERLRTIEQEWPAEAIAQWDEPVAALGEQASKRTNIVTRVASTYRDWYVAPVQFAKFIPPGRYSRAHLQDTQLHYLAELTGTSMRRVRLTGNASSLVELDLAFRSRDTGKTTHLIIGGFDLNTLPRTSPARYDRGWQAPFGIGNPSFFESYEQVVADPPTQRTFYGFHVDEENRWLDHHAIGVDGPLLHRDAEDPLVLHLYLLSYERHALLNHFVVKIPPDSGGQL